MKEKTCFKCGRTQPLSEFYVHGMMADGRLNKCKTCTKRDVKEREAHLRATDPLWTVKERKRCREKQMRRRADGLDYEDPLAARARNENYATRNPQKRKAHIAVQHLWREPCIVCGNPDGQKHHEDYSKPKEVIFLCREHHAMRHVQINDCKAVGISAPSPSPTMFSEESEWLSATGRVYA